MRRAWLAWMGFVLLAFSLSARAGEELTLTVDLTSTEHELAEGYFSLGQTASVVARPGSPLHGWLRGHLGQRVRMSLAVAPPESAH